MNPLKAWELKVKWFAIYNCLTGNVLFIHNLYIGQ